METGNHICDWFPFAGTGTKIQRDKGLREHEANSAEEKRANQEAEGDGAEGPARFRRHGSERGLIYILKGMCN